MVANVAGDASCARSVRSSYGAADTTGISARSGCPIPDLTSMRSSSSADAGNDTASAANTDNDTLRSILATSPIRPCLHCKRRQPPSSSRMRHASVTARTFTQHPLLLSPTRRSAPPLPPSPPDPQQVHTLRPPPAPPPPPQDVRRK